MVAIVPETGLARSKKVPPASTTLARRSPLRIRSPGTNVFPVPSTDSDDRPRLDHCYQRRLDLGRPEVDAQVQVVERGRLDRLRMAVRDAVERLTPHPFGDVPARAVPGARDHLEILEVVWLVEVADVHRELAQKPCVWKGRARQCEVARSRTSPQGASGNTR